MMIFYSFCLTHFDVALMEMIESSISRYTLGANQTIDLPIASAMLELDTNNASANNLSDRIYVPFVKSISFRSTRGSSPGRESSVSLTIDYFVHHLDRNKVDKHVYKGEVSSFEISRLHFYPHDVDESSSVEISDERLKCLLMVLCPSSSAKRRFSKFGKSGSKMLSVDSIRHYVTKVVLSVSEGSRMQVEIDGDIWDGVRFLSASPLWGGRVRSISVAGWESRS